MEKIALLVLAIASVPVASVHFGTSQKIGLDGKPFYVDSNSPAKDDSLEIRSIHDFYYHDSSGRRIVDPTPHSTYWKAEIHCGRDLCGYDVDLFASDYIAKYEDVSCILDGGNARVYFFPTGVAYDDYRHAIKHDIVDFTVDGISALLGSYGLGISPEIGKFESSSLTEEEVVSFYKLPENVHVPSDRPYTWSNSVATIDGVTSFPTNPSHHASFSSPLLALSGVSPDSYSDWTLLNAGWAYADAVLTTGEILRHEPTTVYVPFQEMMDFRRRVLGKEGSPVNVVVTGSGRVSAAHPVISTPSIRTLVFTSSGGWKNIHEEWRGGCLDSPKMTAFEDYEAFSFDEINTEVLVLKSDQTFRLNFRHVFRILRQTYNILFLDVTAGSVVLGSLVTEKILDEYRLTQSGAFLGHTPDRTLMLRFPKPFDFPQMPLLRFEGIRLGANLQHIFIRSLVDYSRF